MAIVSLGLPVFKGTEDDDLERFIDLYIGHLNALGINPLDRAGNPSGAKRAMGILRSCMQGPASIWFDRELTGKNWKIAHIKKQGVAVMGAFRALIVPEGAGGPNNNTYVPHTTASAYATNPANVAVTIGNAFIPDGRLKGGDPLWKRSGGQPTNDDPNTLRNHINGNGNPIVLPDIFPDQALFWLRDQYTTVLEEKQRLRFGTLSQDVLPVKEYYEKIVRSARMLGFGDEIVQDQFFRGLAPENILEAERIGIDRPVAELVNALERVEKRKAEMHLGLVKRQAQENYYNRTATVTPIKAPPVSQQEAVELKPIAQHAITQDMIDKLLQSHTENLTKAFQSQIQALQDNVAKVTQPSKASQRPLTGRRAQEFYEDQDPGAEDSWRAYGTDESEIFKMVAKASAKAKKAKMDRKVEKLANALGDLDIYDDDPNDPMDLDMVRIGDVIVNKDDLNEYFANLIRSIKKK